MAAYSDTNLEGFLASMKGKKSQKRKRSDNHPNEQSSCSDSGSISDSEAISDPLGPECPTVTGNVGNVRNSVSSSSKAPIPVVRVYSRAAVGSSLLKNATILRNATVQPVAGCVGKVRRILPLSVQGTSSVLKLLSTTPVRAYHTQTSSILRNATAQPVSKTVAGCVENVSKSSSSQESTTSAPPLAATPTASNSQSELPLSNANTSIIIDLILSMKEEFRQGMERVEDLHKTIEGLQRTVEGQQGTLEEQNRTIERQQKMIERQKRTIEGLQNNSEILGTSSPTDVEEARHLYSFPINEPEVLHSFAEELKKNAKYRRCMIRYLNVRSSNLLNHCSDEKLLSAGLNKAVNEMCYTLISNELAVQFSMKGRNPEKIAFEVYCGSVIELIFESIRLKVDPVIPVEVLSIKKSISEWFRVAKGRTREGKLARRVPQ